MAPIPKIPETVEEYQMIVEYIRSETFPDSILKSPITPLYVPTSFAAARILKSMKMEFFTLSPW